MNNTIYSDFIYTSAPCGSGKTTTLCKQINNSTDKHLIIAPNKKLCLEIYNNLEGAVLIYSDDTGSTSERLIKALKIGHQRIVSTHQTFSTVIGREDLKDIISDYHLTVDEDMQCVQDMTITLNQRSYSAFHGQIGFNIQGEFADLIPKSKQRMKEDMQDDYFWSEKHPKELCEKILNPAYSVITSLKDREKLLNHDFDENEKFVLPVICIFHLPYLKLFKSCHFLTALFEHSEIKAVLNKFGEIAEPSDLALPYAEHTNGSRMVIKYFVDHKASIRFMETEKSEITNAIKIRDFIQKDLNGEPCIYNTNLRHRDAFSQIPNSELVKESVGVNSYQGIHNAICLSAYNPNVRTAALMKAAGLDVQALVTARSAHQKYQFACRGSIRNPSCNEQFTVYVLSRIDAQLIQAQFSGSQMVQVGIDLNTRPKAKHGTLSEGTKKELKLLRARRSKLNKLKVGRGELTNKQQKTLLEVNFRIEELTA